MGLGHYCKRYEVERGSRGSNKGHFSELKTSALQMHVYQSTLQAISLKSCEIVAAVQPHQGMARYQEEWEERVCLLY